MPKLSRWEQEEVVMDLICGFDTMDEDEFEEKYEMLSERNKQRVDDAALEFADNAIGSTSWRSDW